MRNKVITLTSILVIAALFLAVAPRLSALAQTSTPGASTPPAASTGPRTLSVTGTGRAYLTPDIVSISIGVHTEAPDAADAVEANTTQSNKVAAALRSFQIDAKDIQTSNFSIYPQQQYDNNGKLTGTTYVVDNTVYVTLRDLDKIGDVLNGVIEAGANSITGITFDVADKAEAMAEARKSAIADAKTQAEELAEAAGLTLGAIRSIDASSSRTPIPFYEARGGALAQDSASVPVSPGQLALTVDVNIVYEIQ